jgi:class 3 adenylate cyclase
VENGAESSAAPRRETASDGSTQPDEVARRANVPVEFVRDLVALGALRADLSHAVQHELGRVRLLHAWSQAGFPPETIMRLVHKKALSITFLDTPSVQGPGRLDRSYEEIAAERGVPVSLVERLHESIGFEPPTPHDRAGEDDLALLAVLDLFRSVGVPDEAVARLFGVYADAAGRLAKAEAELYEAHIEERLRTSGKSERELIEFGTEFGARVSAALEQALVMVYRRHRVHVWTEHSVNHVDAALEAEGIEGRIPQPPAICFVDLTGYTRLTEERGDRFAADVAAQLASLVKDISRRQGGNPIRWLGDGGMFHFRDPARAVHAGLDMVEQAPAIGLPPAHIGIHAGPVIFQDGDVYGRTVNLASRLASVAQAGEVVVSDDVAERAAGFSYEDMGPVTLKGVTVPMRLFRAARSAESVGRSTPRLDTDDL